MPGLPDEIRLLLIEVLDLEDIEPQDIKLEAPLFVDGLGLDSIDALELGVALQKRYGIKIDGDTEDVRQSFYSISTLCNFVASSRRP